MPVLFSNALITVALDIVLLAAYTRAARRALRTRQNGTRAMAHTALTRPVVILTCVSGVYRVCTKMLLMRWVRRIVGRAERDKQRHADQPSSP